MEGPIPAVFGAYGETNKEFIHILAKLAATGARTQWRQMLFKTEEIALGVFTWRVRRQVGMAILRANAILKRSRMLLMLGLPTDTAQSREAASRFRVWGRNGRGDMAAGWQWLPAGSSPAQCLGRAWVSHAWPKFPHTHTHPSLVLSVPAFYISLFMVVP